MQTIIDILEKHVKTHPNKKIFEFLADGENIRDTLTFLELSSRAKIISAKLQQTIIPGKRVLLCYSQGLEFICAFFACLYAGIIAVPAYPLRNNHHRKRILSIIEDCQPSVILGTSESLASMKNLEIFSSLHYLETNKITDVAAREHKKFLIKKETIAFLQYTSGSTGSPKGVMLTHNNIMANEEAIRLKFELDHTSFFVSWLPMYHDMGLIGMIIQTIYSGCRQILMSPHAFVEEPIRWLRVMNHLKMGSGAPNFGYHLCIEKIRNDQLSDLDLSHWNLAFTGSEPIQVETMNKFAEKFAVCGFNKNAFLPCYGLAETTLLVSGKPAHESPVICKINYSALAKGIFKEDETSGHAIVSSGTIDSQYTVKIVNPHNCQCSKPNEIGEIWINGPSVAQGYWNKPEITETVFHAHLKDDDRHYLRTGDLGYIKDGQLYVTGRLKDLIILQGRNVYPHDIETAVESCHTAIRAGSTAAFSITVGEQEQLVIVSEIKRTARKINHNEIFSAIRQAVMQEVEAIPYSIHLIKPATALRTSSGKIQRQATKSAYLASTLETLAGDDLLLAPRTDISLETINADIITMLSKVLGLLPEKIDIKTPLVELGGTSLDAVIFQQQLQTYVGEPVTLSSTLAYDYPTVERLSNYLYKSLDERKSNDVVDKKMDEIAIQEPIAIIGMSCRFPGHANNPDLLWELIQQNKEGIIEIPSERFIIKEENISVHRAGIVEDIDKFDASFFNIPLHEAEFMDPQQRLLLEITWHALEDANIDPTTLQQSNTAVFVGASTHEYSDELIKAKIHDVYIPTGNSNSILSGRISYVLGLQGPCETIDTACSSSLVALHEACKCLHLKECNLAIAGGVNVLLSPDTFILLEEAKMLSKDGHCKVFSKEASGYVRGEGCGIVILKRISDAKKDGDRILAIVKSSAVNQDGTSNGLTAPNGLAQVTLLQKALQQAQLSPAEIDYLEVHGAATTIGDAIEVNAISEVFHPNRKNASPLKLGCVKANIGHLEAASGIAGLIKILCCFKHDAFPPQLYADNLNQNLKLDKAISIPTELAPWKKNNHPRRAGISRFSFSGTNAHIIVEDISIKKEIPPSIEKQLLSKKYCLSISAKTKKALEEQIENYCKFLERTAEAVHNICYTSQVGRAKFHYYIAVSGSTTAELLQNLLNKNFLNAAEINTLVDDDANKEYKSYLHCVSLPFYPFQHKRYWPQKLLNYNKEQDSLAAPLLIRETLFIKQYENTLIENRKQFLRNALLEEINRVLEITEIDKISDSCNLIELGVDSLKSIALYNQLRALLGAQFKLPQNLIGENPTLGQLITSIEEFINNQKSLPKTITVSAEKKEIPRNDYAKFENYPDYAQLVIQKNNLKALTDKPLFLDLSEGIASNIIIVDNKSMIHFSGYNYLGMSGDPKVSKAAIEAINQYGTSVSASRLASGDKPIHRELEKALAKFIGGEDAAVFSAGFLTNASTISYLFGKNDMIILDSLAHNSIVYGANASGADQYVFAHNNFESLESILENIRDSYQRVLIVIEGVYSMDGDIPNLPKFLAIKKKYDAFLMIDEAHSAGTIGKTGHGIREYYNIDAKEVDIWMGTLSKSFASCGGYIVGNQALIDLLKYKSPGFVYSCGISPANAAASLAALNLCIKEPQRVTKIHENSDYLRMLLRQNGVDIGLSYDTPIIPIMLGEVERTLKFNVALRQNGIYCHPIIYPIVEKNKARVRLFINCLHTKEQLNYTAETIIELNKRI